MYISQIGHALRDRSDQWIGRIPLPRVREGIGSVYGQAIMALSRARDIDLDDCVLGELVPDPPESVDLGAADDAYLERWMETHAQEDDMIKLLKGVTHAIVVMSKKEVAEKSNIYGTMFLVFGSDPVNAIGQIHLVKMDSRLVWRPPNVSVNIGGQPKTYPVFKGKVADEISEWGEKSYSLIKKTFGKAQFGHRYRIANDRVYDETENKEASATP